MEQTKRINLFQRMANISSEIGMVAKNLSVGTGNNTYKAVGEADIINAVKPLEFKYGIYSFPMDREIVKEEVIRKNSEDKYGNKKETTNLFVRVKVVYKFVNVDDPSEYITIVSFGDGVDSQDKAPGKAMTYADKYALMKAYKIATGDDPDAIASMENFFGSFYEPVEQQPRQAGPRRPPHKPVAEQPVKEKPPAPTFETATPMNELDIEAMTSLPSNWQASACRGFNVTSVNELTHEQAMYMYQKYQESMKVGK